MVSPETPQRAEAAVRLRPLADSSFRRELDAAIRTEAPGPAAFDVRLFGLVHTVPLLIDRRGSVAIDCREFTPHQFPTEGAASDEYFAGPARRA